MCSQQRADELIRKANRSYADGDFSKVEQYLQEASKIEDASPQTRASICDNLAAFACEQGRFSEAAWWYQKVLSIRCHLYAVGTPELKDTIRNYRLLRLMCSKNAPKQKAKLTA